jgi:hypothetical protein
MAKLIVYVGRDRNKVLSKMGTVNPITTHILKYDIQTDAVDLRQNLQRLLNALGMALNMGWEDISILNYEAGLEVGLLKSLYLIKKSYPDNITIRYSTTMPQACWSANEVLYFGPKDYINGIYLERIKIGNVLDSYSTEVFAEAYEN